MKFGHLPDVLAEVEPLSSRFANAGFRLFLVGGIVRDQWLGVGLDDSSDIDLTTDARPPDILQLVTSFADDVWTQGEKFGTIGIRASGRDYEITTFRAESYSSDSRKPVVSFGDNIDVDLSRRDFTVNAMAIELPGGELVDPHGGATDLEARLLRTPLSPEISFTDDPLRMLRAARFSAKYSLVATPELVASATEFHQRIRIVAIERIGVEVRRLLGLDRSPDGLRFLAETGLFAEVLAYGQPDLVPVIQPRLDRAIAVVSDSPRDWHLALSAIGLVVFETVEGVQAMCQRLRLSRDDARAIVAIAKASLATPDAEESDDPTMRRFITEHGEATESIELAFRLLDQRGDEVAVIEALTQLVAGEDPQHVELIDGSIIMAELELAPGPEIGQAHAFLQDSYFARGPLSQDDQIALVRTWWAEQQRP